MAYLFAQAGSTLQRISGDGTTAQEMELLDHLQLSTSRKPRFAILQGRVCLTNSPSFNVMLVPGDAIKGTDDRMVPMSPTPPLRAVRLAAGTDAGLTGAYNVRVSFAVKDLTTGAILAESPLGPTAEAVTLSNKTLAVSGLPIPNEPGINSRRLYRTLTGASATYYHWEDVDDITTTNITAAVSDEVLSQTPATPDNQTGNPPGSWGGDSRLDLVTSWKGRLFGRAAGSPFAAQDTLVWSEVRRPDRWPATNFIHVPPVNTDQLGITALVSRRDALGISKRGGFHIITEPGSTPRQISSAWAVSHDSVARHEDIVWFIGDDGAYQWDQSNQVLNISKDKVHTWFTTDDVFKQESFANIQGMYNDKRQSVVWLMPSAKGDGLDRWIEYYPESGVWLGPHVVQEGLDFMLSSVGTYQDDKDLAQVAYGGSDGRLYIETSNGYDGEDQGPLEEAASDLRREMLLDSQPLTISNSEWVSTNLNLQTTYPKAFQSFSSPDYEAPPDAQITMTIEGFTAATPIFSWRNVVSLPERGGSPSLSTAHAQVLGGETILLIGLSTSGDVLVAIPDGGQLSSSNATITIEEVNTGLIPSRQIPRADGVPMIVEVQPQTMGAADYLKYFGELDVLMKAEAGHRLGVETEVDGMKRTHAHDNPIESKARLGRVGSGHRMTLKIEEASTAKVDWFGYNVTPVNGVGRRQEG